MTEPEIESSTHSRVTPPKRKSRKRVFAIMGVILLALLIFGARKWWFARSHVSTDNAQVEGHIIPILPKVGGYVAEVRVRENQRVKGGDTLVVLDDRDLRARLQQTEADLAALLATVSSRTRVGQAEAGVAQAQANAAKANSDLSRIEPLAAQNVVSQHSSTRPGQRQRPPARSLPPRRLCWSALMLASRRHAPRATKRRCSSPIRASWRRRAASSRRSRSKSASSCSRDSR
jgi:membrane fusion protein, multidrug efflux system